MRGFNRAIIMGNLARDPDVRYTASQKAVASFSVAVNRQWNDANGERREEVTFIPVVVWGPSAKNCGKYLQKGSGILVEGRINTRSYEDKTGQKRYVTEVVADSVQFVGGGGQQKQPAQSSERTYHNKPAAGWGGQDYYCGPAAEPEQATSAPMPAEAVEAETVDIPF